MILDTTIPDLTKANCSAQVWEHGPAVYQAGEEFMFDALAALVSGSAFQPPRQPHRRPITS